MKYLSEFIGIRILMVLCCSLSLEAQGQLAWKLQWQDEFNGDGLPDSNFWMYDVGGHGWGNNELQYYTEADTSTGKVENGYLLLTARKEELNGKNYTSARMLTKKEIAMKYGRLEIRAVLPSGRGLWPAIWMLPAESMYGNWPGSGEIDIMEHVGFTPDTVYGSVHTKKFNHVIGTQKTKGCFVENPYTDFHTYAIEWDERSIRFFVDGLCYYQFVNSKKGHDEWPFDQPFRLILNIAVGGNWGGKMGVNEAIFPATMKVDYVRYYVRG